MRDSTMRRAMTVAVTLFAFLAGGLVATAQQQSTPAADGPTRR